MRSLVIERLHYEEGQSADGENDHDHPELAADNRDGTVEQEAADGDPGDRFGVAHLEGGPLSGAEPVSIGRVGGRALLSSAAVGICTALVPTPQ